VYSIRPATFFSTASLERFPLPKVAKNFDANFRANVAVGSARGALPPTDFLESFKNQKNG
jgi:hypothetical protein